MDLPAVQLGWVSAEALDDELALVDQPGSPQTNYKLLNCWLICFCNLQALSAPFLLPSIADLASSHTV